MYKVLNIDGKDYRLEYTIEAALYKDGIDRLVDFLSGSFGLETEAEISKGMTVKGKMELRQQLVKNLKSEIENLPNTALILFYAGLLEYHGPDGDRSVLTQKDAKKLAKFLFQDENSGISDFAELLTVCMNQMAEDGFFKTTGLERIGVQNAEETKSNGKNRAERRAKVSEA